MFFLVVNSGTDSLRHDFSLSLSLSLGSPSDCKKFNPSNAQVACLPGLILMSSLVDRWLCGILESLSEIRYRLELKCVPLEDLFRTKPGVKSTQVRSVKEPDITDL